jgi:flagellar hook assembly protein FlgD
LSEATPVKLNIYNLIGEKVATLVNEYQAAGYYSVDWNANDSKGKQLENGLYLPKLETGNNIVQTMKTILLR